MDDKNQQLEEMQANLAAADVHSPVTGVIVARRGEPGRMLDPDEASELFQIAVDLSLLQAVFEPDPGTLGRIKPGQTAFVTVPDLQTDALPAAIKEMNDGEAVAELTSAHAGIAGNEMQRDFADSGNRQVERPQRWVTLRRFGAPIAAFYA